MQEQFLDGNLLRNGTVGVAVEADALLGCLQAHLLDIAPQDGLVANNPDNLVDDRGRGLGLRQRLTQGVSIEERRGGSRNGGAATYTKQSGKEGGRNGYLLHLLVVELTVLRTSSFTVNVYLRRSSATHSRSSRS